MNVFSSTLGSFITFMLVDIEISVRERNSLALSSGRNPELIRTAPITMNAPIIANNGIKALEFFVTADIIVRLTTIYNYEPASSHASLRDALCFWRQQA